MVCTGWHGMVVWPSDHGLVYGIVDMACVWYSLARYDMICQRMRIPIAPNQGGYGFLWLRK